MLSDIQRPVSASVVKSIWRSVLAGNSFPVDPVFPAKDFYFTDFAGIADATTLRSLEGWAAYNSASATTPERDGWIVQAGSVIRTTESYWDYDPAPGKFIIGRDTGSADHVLRFKVSSLPLNGETLMVAIAATAQDNSIVFTCQNFNGSMQGMALRKNVGGVLSLLTMTGGPTSGPLFSDGLTVGDTVELRSFGRKIHLLINGIRITQAAGADVDEGGAFTKGNICGFGTGQGLGFSVTDVYVAALTASLSVTDSQIFWPGAMSPAGRNVPLAGSYSGDVQAIDYRVINAATGAETKPWVRISATTISPSSWSASVFVPMCDTATNPKVRVELRAANDVDSVAPSTNMAVGICVGSYGQSNSTFRGQGYATPHAVSNSYTFSDDDGVEWLGGASVTTTRSQLWASKMSEQTGIPVGIFVAGWGSKTIVELSKRGSGDDVLDEMEALCQLANAYGYVGAWLWTQGEAEASAALIFDEGAYRSQFDVLLSELRGPIAANSSAPVGVCVIGRTSGGHINGATFGDANWSAVRSGLSRLNDKPGVFMATHLTDATLVDSLHYTADAYVENGRRAGLSMRKALGYGAYDGRGPLVTGATRSGAVVTLAIDLNGAASIAGTGLTHYQVSADNFATLLTISSAAVSGGNIALTLSADHGAAVKVRSFYGMDWTSPVRAIGTYADGTTIPVEPIFSAITSN